MYVTTSWDDGYPQDVKLAELLNKYHVKGTFYIPTLNIGHILPEDDLIEISRYHEIGSHTHTHLFMTAVDSATCMEELKKSKRILEDLLGESCTSFCYPRGMYNASIKELVKKAGYTCARTVRHYYTMINDPLELHPTLHASKYGIIYCVKGSLKLHMLGVRHIFNWVSFAKRTFDYVYKHSGVWHLWGHSWEIEENEMWDELEEVLKYVSGRKDVKYVSNGALALLGSL